jgi:hypothetical protein
MWSQGKTSGALCRFVPLAGAGASDTARRVDKVRDVKPFRVPLIRRRKRRGMVMLYTIISMVALTGICSLAVDVGHVQMVKSDMQACADATARGYMEYYQQYGQATANSLGPLLYSAGYNPVDSNSGVTPTVSATWGTWDTSSNTFMTSGGSGYTALKVTVSRTKANQNAVPLTWGAVIGDSSCDLSVTAIAATVGGQSTTVTVSGTSDPYLSGMPAGSTASYDDTTTNASPYQVSSSIPVIPGSWMTFTSITGGVSHTGSGSGDSASGDSTLILDHGADSPGGPTPAAENGIADAFMPIDSFLGVFLTNSAPNLAPAPATRDYTNAATRNQTQYSDILLQQPFYIGDGLTSGNVTQQFQVPLDATRLYLGTWDGHEWKNNTGSFTATVTVVQSVQLMQ